VVSCASNVRQLKKVKGLTSVWRILPMGNFLTVIAGEKVPYLVTILFASMGWLITHSVDQIDKSPTVTFEASTKAVGSKYLYTVDLHNVTRTVRVKDLKFGVQIEGKACNVDRAEIKSLPPASSGNSPATWSGCSAAFSIDNLEPNNLFQLSTEYSGEGSPRFYLASASGSIRLITPSLESYFSEHDIPIMVAILVIYLVFIVLVIFHSAPQPAVPDSDEVTD
jgi:hypothetical protein